MAFIFEINNQVLFIETHLLALCSAWEDCAAW
jgi:hypothetical protein